MASSLIREDIMVDMLSNSLEGEGCDEEARYRLRSGAAMMMIDAYDRKATRDSFVDCITAALHLCDAVGQFNSMENVKQFFTERGVITHGDLDTTLDVLRKRIDTCVTRCENIAELLSQCPEDEDGIN